MFESRALTSEAAVLRPRGVFVVGILVVISTVLSVFLAPAAFAHAGFKANAPKPAGGLLELILEVPLEPFEYTGQIPDEANFFNQKVETQIPKGWSIKACAPKQGWTCEVGPKQITWTNGSGATNGFDTEFAFSAQAPAAAGTYFFKTFQTYNSGCTPGPCVGIWNQEAGEEGPSPRVTLVTEPGSGTSEPAAPSVQPSASAALDEVGTPAQGEGGSGMLLAGGAGLLIVLVVLTARSRRKK